MMLTRLNSKKETNKERMQHSAKQMMFMLEPSALTATAAKGKLKWRPAVL